MFANVRSDRKRNAAIAASLHACAREAVGARTVSDCRRIAPLIHQFGSQMPPCRTAFSYVCFRPIADISTNWNVGSMTPATVVRLSWTVLALPLAAIALIVSFLMWPLVLQNNAVRLGLIAYVAACPLLPLVWRSGRLAYVVCATVAALTAQIVAFGIINFWF